MHRRSFIAGAGTLGGLAIANSTQILAQTAPAPAAPAAPAPAAAPAAAPAPPPPFSLPALGYAYEALEPHIDTMTMRIHHSAHHQAFITALNAAAPNWDQLRPANTETLLADIAAAPENVRGVIRNALGGAWNHAYFWDIMTPGGATGPTGNLKTAIEGSYGSISDMVQRFNAAAMGRFGSGWAWLVVDKDKKLAIINTPYQDTPLELGAKAIIGCDVWEHAYYLKHQNRRADYMRAWWNTVNWDKAMGNFAKATG